MTPLIHLRVNNYSITVIFNNTNDAYCFIFITIIWTYKLLKLTNKTKVMFVFVLSTGFPVLPKAQQAFVRRLFRVSVLA